MSRPRRSDGVLLSLAESEAGGIVVGVGEDAPRRVGLAGEAVGAVVGAVVGVDEAVAAIDAVGTLGGLLAGEDAASLGSSGTEPEFTQLADPKTAVTRRAERKSP